MKTNKAYIVVAALLGTVLMGCQKEEQIQPEANPEVVKTWKLTVQVSKGADDSDTSVDTKAMGISGSKLSSTWKVGEKVNVFLAGTCLGQLEVESTKNNGAQATLSGRIKVEGISENSDSPSTLMLLFPGRDDEKWTYLGQDGSAPSESGTMATGYDYSVKEISAYADTSEQEIKATVVSSSFASQQSVYRFGFKVGGTGDPIEVDSYTLTSNKNKLVREMVYSGGSWTSQYGAISVTQNDAPAGNLYYMAIRNENDETTEADRFTFTVVRSSDSALLEGYRDIPGSVLGNGKYLGASISVSQKTMAPAAGSISSVNAVL